MACNCKANQQILELGKRYGTTVFETRKDILKSGVWKAIQRVFLGIFAILAAPIMFFYIVYKANVKGEKIFHIDRIIGINRK